MQLYSFFNSSTSYRVRIALALKDLHYTYHGVNIRVGEQCFADYAALNPSKGVPLLVDDDGTALSQSMAIMQYLDDQYPQAGLIPEEPQLKARVLEVANAIACDMHPVNNLRVLGYLKSELGITDAQKDAWYAHWAREGFNALETLLGRHGGAPYCFGQAPTLADVCLVPQVANVLRMGLDMAAYPRVMAVYEHCQGQSAFQQAAPSAQPDFQG
ncbi:maleylacetoacetate isomerase [Marinobacterium aestuarii]|uniref:Maleylacetoacetate isomerase n=1 Tax=Marinobacterium aestuarii TaxID=1821621 RepID=A0A1A9EZU1_9GAMM|nr:maleylacetoacetate isomerase [Marinobacterium aestuarii]ANG63407.1 maleylacetoacetate isomerase [Marinobacterium aestuarii]